MGQKITTFLWFDNQAEEAMEFYTSLFPDSKVVDVSHYGEAGPGAPGSVMAGTFQLAGQDFMVLNGGPQHFHFNESVSLFVRCEDQAEVDRLWDALTSNGGEESFCGWLKDRYGLSWQIVPTVLTDLLGSPDKEQAARVMHAMLKMRKIDIAELRRAAAGDSV